jgi:hypothetical protein
MIAFLIRALVTLIICSILGMIALAAMLGGVGLFGWALYMALGEVVSPQLAALLTGFAAFGMAVLFALLALYVLRLGARPPRSMAAPPPVAGTVPDAAVPGAGYDAAAQLGGFIGSQAAMLFRSRPLAAPLIAMAVGLAVGLSPRLRQMTFRFWR